MTWRHVIFFFFTILWLIRLLRFTKLPATGSHLRHRSSNCQKAVFKSDKLRICTGLVTWVLYCFEAYFLLLRRPHDVFRHGALNAFYFVLMHRYSTSPSFLNVQILSGVSRQHYYWYYFYCDHY